MLTSSIDKRLYRNIILKNELQCLFISDPDTEKSSACCDVQVGSLSDPIDAQGLAHFLEHMLFLGTEKYPVENSYSSFLNAHGGYSNAYTSQENTVYYFDVQNDAFEQALDMFASFFICPLFTESSTSREINAVDSENKKNLQSDSWRKFQLLKSLAREGHPITMFSTGNIETLGQNADLSAPNSGEASPLRIRDLMMDFHEKNYSANLMKLVFYSNQSLDSMQSWAEALFSGIRNKNLTRNVVPGDAYGNNQLRKYLEIVPIRDMKKIEVLFPIPPKEHLYLSKPTGYLCHLLGHESDGSLLAALKQRRWAQALSAYCSPSLRDLAFLGVTVELTQEGLAHIDDVVEGLFAYIGLLRREGVLPWVWEELSDTAKTHFRFLNKVEPAEYATQLAENMHKYPPEHVLAGGELLFEMDLPAVSSYLSALVPERCIVLVMNSAFAGRTDKKERWYGTDYNIGDLSAEQLSMWQGAMSGGCEQDRWKDLHMPQPNPFIPTVFDLKSSSSSSSEEAVSVVKKEYVPPCLLTCPRMVGDALVGDSEYIEAEEEKESLADPLTPPPPPAEDENGQEEEEEGDEGEGGESSGQAPPSPVAVPVGQCHPVLTWFKADDVWDVPKGGVYLTLESGFCSGGPLAVALTDLLAQLLKEKLSEYSYYADCAGLQYDVQLSRGGLELSVRGYDHKLRLLLERALLELKRIAQQGSSTSDGPDAISPALFERVKERALLNYKNYLFWQPYYHCIYGSLFCMEEPRWSNADKFHALSPANLGDLTSFANAFLRSLKAELLVHGNFLSTEAAGLPDLVQSSLGFKPLPITQEPIRRTVALTQGVEYVFRQHCKSNNPNEVNSAVENIYIVCPGAIRYGAAPVDSDALLLEESCTSLVRTMYASAENATSQHPGALCIEALLELLTHMMSEPAFDQLRTKEQLGYIVFSGIKKIGQVLAVQLIVQSGHRGPAFLDDRVESFLAQYRTELAGYSEDVLGGFVEAVCEKLTEKPKNIDQESSVYWEEIKSGSYLFDRRKQLALALQAATRPDLRNALLQLFDYFLLATDTRRKLSSQFFGRGAKGKGTGAARSGQRVLISSAAEFKRSSRLHSVQFVDRKTLQQLLK